MGVKEWFDSPICQIPVFEALCECRAAWNGIALYDLSPLKEIHALETTGFKIRAV